MKDKKGRIIQFIFKNEHQKLNAFYKYLESGYRISRDDIIFDDMENYFIYERKPRYQGKFIPKGLMVNLLEIDNIYPISKSFNVCMKGGHSFGLSSKVGKPLYDKYTDFLMQQAFLNKGKK